MDPCVEHIASGRPEDPQALNRCGREGLYFRRASSSQPPTPNEPGGGDAKLALPGLQ